FYRLYIITVIYFLVSRVCVNSWNKRSKSLAPGDILMLNYKLEVRISMEEMDKRGFPKVSISEWIVLEILLFLQNPLKLWLNSLIFLILCVFFLKIDSLCYSVKKSCDHKIIAHSF
ncbi:hypothetical protein DMB44_09010, partial [Thermoplasma sp. Kam2015]